MNAPVTITGTVGAWLSSSTNANHVEDLIASGDEAGVVKSLFFSPHDMAPCGWTQIGEATVSVTLAPRSDRMAQALETLRQQLAKERAESMVRQNAILDQISKLQSLTYDAPEAAA
jgi:hypothetical protein